MLICHLSLSLRLTNSTLPQAQSIVMCTMFGSAKISSPSTAVKSCGQLIKQSQRYSSPSHVPFKFRMKISYTSWTACFIPGTRRIPFHNFLQVVPMVKDIGDCRAKSSLVIPLDMLQYTSRGDN